MNKVLHIIVYLILIAAVAALGLLPLGPLPLLALQILAGAAVYAAGSWLLNRELVQGILQMVKKRQPAGN